MLFSIDEAPFLDEAGSPHKDRDALGHAVVAALSAHLAEKARTCNELAETHKEIGYPHFEWFERDILLRILDSQWKDHLHTMDGLREGIGLRGYAQKDPKVEYQREGYDLFEAMSLRVDFQAIELLFKFVLPEPRLESEAARPVRTVRAGSAIERDPAGQGGPRVRRGKKAGAAASGKIGRNDPCPCGSGQKYKKCCGA